MYELECIGLGRGGRSEGRAVVGGGDETRDEELEAGGVGSGEGSVKTVENQVGMPISSDLMEGGHSIGQPCTLGQRDWTRERHERGELARPLRAAIQPHIDAHFLRRSSEDDPASVAHVRRVDASFLLEFAHSR